MSKIMRPLSMTELLGRTASEWASKGGAWDIAGQATKRLLELEAGSPGFTVNGLKVGLPVGPAAGPHTQSSQNLVAAWLAGARVFELKTVQENDRLDIDKPCIDALDEGHNVEWSTELSLDEARSEYLNAWVAIRLLGAALSEKPVGVLFNMSVGYTLDGIAGARMDAFIEGLARPAGTAAWAEALAGARRAIGSGAAGGAFRRAFGGPGTERAMSALSAMEAAAPGSAEASPIHSATISTMHGCPPAEIERIGGHLIENKGLDTYVKLNPTLLGYDEARAILDATGWKRISVKRPTFERDLGFDAALELVASLRGRAKAAGRKFGIKLSNTLANVNDGKRLPGAERYMSGRPLFPLTARLAARLAQALPDAPAFSFCAGVGQANAYDCLRAGLGPLTAVTDMLKPGGYLRLEGMAIEAVRALKDGVPSGPDAARLGALATAALAEPRYRGDYKRGHTSIAKALPAFDCFASPCIVACPAHQRAPAYIKALAKGEPERAMSITLEDNPLPRVTGVLCDHVCQDHCARVDYEGAVRIRDAKLAVARAADRRGAEPPSAQARIEGKGKAAVIGAGPAGLSCAHYLALAGYPVTVFDRAERAGGVPANVIPEFRIDPKDIEADVNRIRALGASFELGYRGPLDNTSLAARGYTSIVIAGGAPSPRGLSLEGSGVRVVDALEFLAAARSGSGAFEGAKAIAVAGGGNTAMDAARAARRLAGNPSVELLYRRTLEEMPADREEFEAALAEGARYSELSLPVAAVQGTDGSLPKLRVRAMALGAPDASGRRSPEPTDSVRDIACDLLVAAIGESPDRALLESYGARIGADGRPVVDPETMEAGKGLYIAGDARRGPSSIIAAEADGRKAAYSVLKAAGVDPGVERRFPPPPDFDALSRRGLMLESLPAADPGFAAREAERCLSCGSACLRCVEVCPNRANTAVSVAVADGGAFRQSLQILHLDELCNECGNCGFFCPYDGEPYKGKPTLYRDRSALEAGTNAGFAFEGGAEPALVVRYERALAGGAAPAIDARPYAAWTAAKDPMAALAKAALTDHAYLIPGGER